MVVPHGWDVVIAVAAPRRCGATPVVVLRLGCEVVIDANTIRLAIDSVRVPGIVQNRANEALADDTIGTVMPDRAVQDPTWNVRMRRVDETLLQNLTIKQSHAKIREAQTDVGLDDAKNNDEEA